MKQYVEQYRDDMLIFENILLQLFEEGEKDEEELECLKNFEQQINEQKIHKNHDRLGILLHMLVIIANNHHRCSFFFKKLEKIILSIKDAMHNLFSNKEIINIFKSNKRILLFLIEAKIIIVDEYFISKITKEKYQNLKYIEYFAPEIQSFYDNTDDINLQKINIPKVLPDNFDKNRKIGENESPLCELIRNDAIIDFVIYVNKTNLFLNSQINSSIFETNSFLIDKKPTLIEYAAFFGSIQIIKYLLLNKVEPTSTLMQYAIHSKNGELIHLLEENIKINPKECFIESIKCHHNDIASYLKDNFLQNKKERMLVSIKDSFKTKMPIAFCYYNFQFFTHDLDLNAIEFPFYFLSKYKYIEILAKYLEEYNFDINDFLINIDDYEIIEDMKDLLWRYGYNNYLVKNKHTSQIYMMQILVCGYEYNGEPFEKSIKFNYPCILKPKGYSSIDFYHEKCPSILYELKPKCNLFHFIKHKYSFIHSEIRDTYDYILILGIAIGLRCFSKRNSIDFYVHSYDILIDENYYPVISNYGRSFRAIFLQKTSLQNNSILPIESQVEIPPEGLHFEPSSMVYMYSIIVYLIIVKKVKFEKEIAVVHYYQSIRSGNRPDVSLIKNQYIVGFLQKCWAFNPDDRLSYDEIIDYITNKEFYSYFQSFDRKAVLQYLNIYGNEYDYIKKNFI